MWLVRAANPNAVISLAWAISGHLRRFCLFVFYWLFCFSFLDNRNLSKLQIDRWLNQIGCESLKWNNEWWRGEMWTLNRLTLYWSLSCNRSCFIYMWYTPRRHVRCNFLKDEWLQNLEISMLFVLAFYQLLTTEVQYLRKCERWNN